MIGSSAYVLYMLAISYSVCPRNGEYIFNFTFCQRKLKPTFPAPQCSSLTIALRVTGGFLISGPEVFSKDSLIASDWEGSCTPSFCICTNDQTSWLFHKCWTWLLALPKTNHEPWLVCEGMDIRWTIHPPWLSPCQQTAKPGWGSPLHAQHLLPPGTSLPLPGSFPE